MRWNLMQRRLAKDGGGWAKWNLVERHSAAQSLQEWPRSGWGGKREGGASSGGRVSGKLRLWADPGGSLALVAWAWASG